MATFGPALFQYFADTVQFDDDGFVKPYVQADYDAAGFGRESEKIMDSFKNALFKIVMLRARNEAIHNIECGRGDTTSVFVDMHMELSDAHFHIDSDDVSETPYATPNHYAQRVQGFAAREANINLPEAVVEKDRCAENIRLRSEEIIHNDFARFSHDLITDTAGNSIDGTNLSQAKRECMKPMTCGASDALLDQHLVGDLKKYRTNQS